MNIHIALCTDENFVIPALTCITSVLENNREDFCSFTILTSGLSDYAHKKFERLSSAYGRPIAIKDIDEKMFCNLPVIDRYPLSMYYRFLLPEVLTTESRVLYLDCDTIVRQSLRALFQTDLAGKACAVVEDQQSDDTLIINRLRLTETYFNSGVMLLNLAYWREHDIPAALIHCIKENYHQCTYPDQDALNMVLRGKVRYLPYTYNCQEMWITQRQQARFHYSKWPALDVAINNPAIVHFCVGDKPWYEECKNPFATDFLKYAYLHPFIGFVRKKKYGYLYHRLVAWEMRFHRWSLKLINK